METEKESIKGSLTEKGFSEAFLIIVVFFFKLTSLSKHTVQVNDVNVLDTMLLPLWYDATITLISHTFMIILIYTIYDNASALYKYPL